MTALNAHRHVNTLTFLALTTYNDFLTSIVYVTCTGLAVTFCRKKSLPRIPPLSKTLYITFFIFYLYTLCFPPQAAVPNDLLLDGLIALMEKLTRKPVLPSLTLERNTTVFGESNLHLDRLVNLDPLNAPRHVFIIFLESAHAKAFPYDPTFCDHEPCNIPPEYNTPLHFTPHLHQFASLPTVKRVTNFFAFIAYSVKSHLATVCGVAPAYASFDTEINAEFPLPCLPNFLKGIDETFRSASFESDTLVWDQWDKLQMQKFGVEKVYGKEQVCLLPRFNEND